MVTTQATQITDEAGSTLTISTARDTASTLHVSIDGNSVGLTVDQVHAAMVGLVK